MRVNLTKGYLLYDCTGEGVYRVAAYLPHRADNGKEILKRFTGASMNFETALATALNLSLGDDKVKQISAYIMQVYEPRRSVA